MSFINTIIILHNLFQILYLQSTEISSSSQNNSNYKQRDYCQYTCLYNDHKSDKRFVPDQTMMLTKNLHQESPLISLTVGSLLCFHTYRNQINCFAVLDLVMQMSESRIWIQNTWNFGKSWTQMTWWKVPVTYKLCGVVYCYMQQSCNILFYLSPNKSRIKYLQFFVFVSVNFSSLLFSLWISCTSVS